MGVTEEYRFETRWIQGVNQKLIFQQLTLDQSDESAMSAWPKMALDDARTGTSCESPISLL
jgi:hypothetical protein